MSRAPFLIPSCLGGVAAMLSFYARSSQLPKLAVLGLAGGLAGGWLVYLLSQASLETPDSLPEPGGASPIRLTMPELFVSWP